LVTNLEDINSENIKVFPNPTQDKIWLSGNLQNLSVYQLIDAQGKIILSNSPKVHKDFSLDLGKFPEGLYFLKLYSNKKVVYKKIIKQ